LLCKQYYNTTARSDQAFFHAGWILLDIQAISWYLFVATLSNVTQFIRRSRMSKLIAGIARANVTPPVGMLMSGYASRKTGAVGVHDELRTVALYLTDGETEAALISADIIGISAEGTARVREACAAVSGVPGKNILVAFSHTHGGPQTDLRRTDSTDGLGQAYGTVLVHKMAGALSEAKLNAVPVRVGYGRQDCSFAMNRRERKPDGVVVLGVNPDGPTAPFTDVIRMDRLDSQEPLALIFSYASHGTTMGGDNFLYTADYPGAAKRFVDGQFPTALSSFIAGCSGDINPYPRGEFRHVDQHGKQLGCAVVQAALDIEDMAEDVRIAVARHWKNSFLWTRRRRNWRRFRRPPTRR
jgi:neutral ceramidase